MPPKSNTVQYGKIQEAVIQWWSVNQRRDLPWRKELASAKNVADPYLIWVSEVMSQQTQMETVIRYFDKWVTKFPTVEALAAATEEQVRAVWSGMGYYRRAEYMRKGAQYVVETHRKGSKSGPVALPRRYEELLKIPGVGPYTAAAIASVCYGEPVCAVDGNVVRVLSRLRGERDFDPKVPKNIKKVGEWGKDYITGEGECVCSLPGHFNQGLMEIGAGVCRPSGAPLCETCPLRSFCGAYAALQAGTIPAIESIIPLKAARMKKRDEHVVSVIHELPSETGRKFVVVRRPEDGLLGGMLEFPSVVCLATQAMEVSATLSCACTSLKRVGSFKHIFSHVDMTVDVFHAKWAVPKKPVRDKESLEKSVKAAVVKALNDLNNQKVNVDSVSVKTEDELKQSATSRVLWKSFELIGGAPKTTKKRSRSSVTE